GFQLKKETVGSLAGDLQMTFTSPHLFVGAGGSVDTSGATYTVNDGSIGFTVSGGSLHMLLVPAVTGPPAAASTFALAASGFTVSLIGLPAGFTRKVAPAVYNPPGPAYTDFDSALAAGLVAEADGQIALDGGGFVELAGGFQLKKETVGSLAGDLQMTFTSPHLFVGAGGSVDTS